MALKRIIELYRNEVLNTDRFAIIPNGKTTKTVEKEASNGNTERDQQTQPGSDTEKS